MKRFLFYLTLALLPQLGFATNTTPITGYENGHEWVDLGLPSGTLWATCNVGASSPEENGDYFAWGETSSKVEYTRNNLRYYKTSEGFTKYVTFDERYCWAGDGDPDDKYVLDSDDDAANANWGGKWTTPGATYWKELSDKCTWSWIGSGYKVTGPNGQSIFLPAAGYQNNNSNQYLASNGKYWACARTRSSSLAWVMSFNSEHHGVNGGLPRSYGLSVRPIIKRTYTTGYDNGHEWVDLGLPSGTKWATCNIGAPSPTKCGDYYAWAETSTKTEYTWKNYRFRTNGDKDGNIRLSKYNTDSTYGSVDERKQLEPIDDAAHINWGGKWSIPTKEQWEELSHYCRYEINMEEAQIKLTGPSGLSIVLCVDGYRDGSYTYDLGFKGCYASGSLNADHPYQTWGVVFDLGFTYLEGLIGYSRFYGVSIRPVTH